MVRTASPGVALVCLAAFAGEVAGTDAPAPDRLVLPGLDGPIVAERVMHGLTEPVAIEFLPDGMALILQRNRGLMSVADFATG